MRHGSLRVATALLGALAGPAVTATEPLPVTEVAPGVFVHQGHTAVIAPSNLGDIANIGFIVGADAVAVIDTGGSHAVGLALREAVRRETSRPIRYVILTHVHPDHVLGAGAFDADGVTFVGHHRLPAALAARGEFYAARTRAALGEQAAETRVVPPTLLVTGSMDLDLGGRRLTLTAHPTAHTDSDLTVHDQQSGTLWLSDLLFRGHLPVVDGSLRGWQAVMDVIAALPARRVVPGHGPVSDDWPGAMAPQRRYLDALADEIRALIDGGGTLEQAVARIGLPDAERWELVDEFHRRNVTASFVELEWE